MMMPVNHYPRHAKAKDPSSKRPFRRKCLIGFVAGVGFLLSMFREKSLLFLPTSIGKQAISQADQHQYWKGANATTVQQHTNNVNSTSHTIQITEQFPQTASKLEVPVDNATVPKDAGHDRKEIDESNEAVSQDGKQTPDDLTCIDRIFASKDAKAACDFMESRRQVYAAQNKTQTFQWRGIGYLWHTHKMILLATPQINNDNGNSQEHHIRIQDVYTTERTDCDRFSLWVRVNGPEIMAGKATAIVNSDGESCHWEFPIAAAQQGGTYKVDARALMWDSGHTVNHPCEGNPMPINQKGFPWLPQNLTQQFPIHGGFQGYKMYHPPSMCCEICSRIPSCKQWATPPLLLSNPERAVNGCELFFEQGASDWEIPWSSRLRDHGRSPVSHNGDMITYKDKPHWSIKKTCAYGSPVHEFKDTAYYIGCGWSYWFSADFPCLAGEYDDKIFVPPEQESFQLPDPTMKGNTEQRLCTLDDEHVSPGRWVRQNIVDTSTPSGRDQAATMTCPEFQIVQSGAKFKITNFDDDHPLCWFRDDMTQYGSEIIEFRHLKLLSPASRWLSDIHNETRFSAIWHHDECLYYHYTTTQLQHCITERRISSIETDGDSISKFMDQFLKMRLKDIHFWNATNNDSIAQPSEGVKVIINTLSLAHAAWEHTDKLIEFLNTQLPPLNSTTEHYWMTGWFLSSERELHCHAEKMLEFQPIVRSILEPKGYKMIEAFNLSAAFAYDATAQFDGLHFVGPPPKMVTTKLFHHLCSGVVEGTPI